MKVESLLDAMKEKLGEEEFAEFIRQMGPDEDMQTAVEFFHLTFCIDNHNDEGGCQYYSEQELTKTWSRDSHHKWVQKAEELIKAYTLTTDEFSTVLARVTATLSDVMLCSEPQRLLFLDLLGHEAIQKTVSKEPRGYG